jgi:hypothetical protein
MQNLMYLWIAIFPWIGPFLLCLGNVKYNVATGLFLPLLYVFINMYLNSLRVLRNPGGPHEESIGRLLKRSADADALGLFFLFWFELIVSVVKDEQNIPYVLYAVILGCYIFYFLCARWGYSLRQQIMVLSVTQDSADTRSIG